MRRPSVRHASVRRGLLLVLALAAARPAAAADARIEQQVRELKAIHQEILLGGVRKIDALRAAARRKPRRLAQAFRSGPPRDHREALGPQGASGAPAGLASDALDPPPPNLKLNGPDMFVATQSEEAIAAVGPHLVVAWNDGGSTAGIGDGIGFAASSDGGRTWTDGGPLPRTGEVAVWVSDPVVVVDAARGWFYVAGLVIANGPKSAVAVIRGAFDGGAFHWETPRVVRATRDTFPDKPWLAADSLTGNLYISYTTFFRRDGKNSDQLEFQRSLDGGLSWTPAAKLSADAENGMVQGSRPAVGPDGELHVVWKTIDTTAAAGGLDAIRLRTSHDAGATFGPLVTAANVYTDFCSGPPGFDRGSGLGFPSIAIDRSTGPRRGRIYVSWEESLDFYDDLLVGGAHVAEREPDNTSAAATPFAIGETVHGAIDAPQDPDWFRFQGQQGQTVMVYLDSLDSQLDVALRLWCGDGETRLAYSTAVNVRPRVVLFTLPKSGDYFVTVAPLDDSTGTYRIVTGLARRGLERGRDQRDVFAAYSDDGVAWSAPVRVNDEPPGFDDWLPELAVAADGKPYLAWYDWRDGDPQGCAAASSVYLARSDDGGESWVSLGPMSEVPTLWSGVSSNLSPNMGDYIGLAADDQGVYPCWADGRLGDPDVFCVLRTLPGAARGVAAVGSAPEPGGGVSVRWSAPAGLPVRATAYRRDGVSDWAAIGELESDAAGALALVDIDVLPGYRYRYRLGIDTSEGEVVVGEMAVDVPDASPPRLAIERLGPNPSRGDLQLGFRRPDLGPARIEVIDLGGRRVFARDLGEDFGTRGVLDLGREARLVPGLYVVRFTQSGRAVHAKVVVLR